MELAETRHLGVKLPHVCRRRIFIVFAEVAHDRAVNLRRAIEGRWGIAPGMKRIAAVVHHAGFEIGI